MWELYLVISFLFGNAHIVDRVDFEPGFVVTHILSVPSSMTGGQLAPYLYALPTAQRAAREIQSPRSTAPTRRNFFTPVGVARVQSEHPGVSFVMYRGVHRHTIRERWYKAVLPFNANYRGDYMVCVQCRNLEHVWRNGR